MPTPLPPLDAETALDLTMALCAHRSSNERHAEFGKLIAEQFLVQLPERCADDPVASGYLTELAMPVASAVRAFSVQRDIFQTRWQSLKSEQARLLERSNRYLAFSPLQEDSLWGRIWAVVAALGGSTLVGILSSLLIDTTALWVSAPVLLLFIPASLVLADEILLNRALRLKELAEDSYAPRLEATWENTALCEYPQILRTCLINAIRVQAKWYPDYPTGVPEGDEEAQEAYYFSVIRRHMAFRTEPSQAVLT
jgi:hypothetical protein